MEEENEILKRLNEIEEKIDSIPTDNDGCLTIWLLVIIAIHIGAC